MIEISQLSKSYGRNKVLSDVSLKLVKGSILGLAGPNGCGKTTLIKSILGLVFPEQGNISLSGVSILNTDQYRDSIGYMPQNPDFPAHLTINEMLNMIEEIRSKNATSRSSLFDIFELSQHQNKKFGELSGGTKQKVAACMAFMFDPPLLILDEPTVGLDPISASQFKVLLKARVKEGATVLLVSHIMSEMEQLVDQMVFLLDGKVTFSGSTTELLDRANTTSLEAAVVHQLIHGAVKI